MATTHFPDGFPYNPLEAIQFCDFLTPQEKDEWLGWLQGSDETQQKELVDTLHSIYIEQSEIGKSEQPPVIVETTNVNPSPQEGHFLDPVVQNQEMQIEPNINPQSNPFTPIQEAIVPELIVQPKKAETQKPTPKQAALKLEANKIDPRFEDSFVDPFDASKNPYRRVSSDDDNLPTLLPRNNFNTEPKSMEEHVKKAETLIMSAREVSDLYNGFITSQTKVYNLNNDFQEKQAKLFSKIMEMVQEAAILSDKVLKLNYENVQNARSIQELKNATQIKGGTSLQYQINSLTERLKKFENNLDYSIERIDKDLVDFREDVGSRIDDINSQLAAALADNYKADGIQEQVAKISAKLEMKIEELERKILDQDRSPKNKLNDISNHNLSGDKTMKRPSYVESKLEAAKHNKLTHNESTTSEKKDDVNSDYDSYFKPKNSESPAQKVKINSIKGI